MQAKHCWLQECVEANGLTEEKTRGMVKPADPMTKHLNGAMMRDMCGLLDLKFEAGRAATAPKLEVDSGYVTRCAKLLAAVSLLPVANGEPTEEHHASLYVIAWATASTASSMLMLGLLWLVCSRTSTSKPGTCTQATLTKNAGDKPRVKATTDIDTNACELYWTERGARLHSKRDCVHLRRAKAASTGALCKLCLNAQPRLR